MTVTIKLMMIILLWNNDGSFHSSVSEVKNCPEVETFRAVMEEQRMSGSLKAGRLTVKKYNSSMTVLFERRTIRPAGQTITYTLGHWCYPVVVVAGEDNDPAGYFHSLFVDHPLPIRRTG
jgi:hypothetical protein